MLLFLKMINASTKVWFLLTMQEHSTNAKTGEIITPQIKVELKITQSIASSNSEN